MIRRMFWLVVGVMLGAWAAFRLKRLMRALAPQALVHQASGVGDTVRAFADDVRTAMHAREDQLRDALGLDAPSELPAPSKTDKDHH
jgi:hypothetical protein